MKFIKKYLIRWVELGLLLASLPLHAQTVHISHCLDACPEISNRSNEVVVQHLYAASISPRSGLAEWVAYRVLAESVGVASLLPRFWQEDELLRRRIEFEVPGSEGPRLIQPDLSDAQDREYRLNEVLINPEDRGRLAPITSFADTPYWEELNNLSNMAPLPPDLRLGSWARLEQRINELARDRVELYVVSGPLAVADGQAFFKIIRIGNEEAAFVFPQNLPINADYCQQSSSREEIEQILGLALFPGSSNSPLQNLGPQLGCATTP